MQSLLFVTFNQCDVLKKLEDVIVWQMAKEVQSVTYACIAVVDVMLQTNVDGGQQQFGHQPLSYVGRPARMTPAHNNLHSPQQSFTAAAGQYWRPVDSPYNLFVAALTGGLVDSPYDLWLLMTSVAWWHFV